MSISLGNALGIAFVLATFYALILSTSWGKRWAVALTWTTVVLGDALTLACLALYDREAAINALMFFAVTGTPIIARSLWLDFQERESVRLNDK